MEADFGFGRVREPELGVLGANFGQLILDLLGSWRSILGFGRVQGSDFGVLGADFDLILELSGGLGGHFGVWEARGGLWGLFARYLEDSKGLSSPPIDKAEYFCAFKLKPEFVTFWSPCKF